MKAVFLGTTDFARIVLEGLLDKCPKELLEIVGVVCQPDKKRGRNPFHPVKELALERKLDLIQPENINQPEPRQWISEKNPDLLLVAAYGQILKKKTLDLAPLGSFNLHASLLPRYRGASPIHHAILAGEKETGVTVQKMVRKLDAGPILVQKKIPISEEESTRTLSPKLAQLGVEACLEALELLESGNYHLIPQREEEASYAPLLRREDGEMDWTQDSFYLHCFIRAMDDWPGSWTHFFREGKPPLRVTIHKALPVEGKGEPGEVLQASKELIVATGKGALKILELTPQAKKRISFRDFINGYAVRKGNRFGKSS